MLDRVITCGQTGVDQAAWRTAQKFGYKTSGMMPNGFHTEDGPRPEFKKLYGATESRFDNYAACTQRNAQDADAIIWLGPIGTPKHHVTLGACYQPRMGGKKVIRRTIEIEFMQERLDKGDMALYPIRDLFMGLTTVCVAGTTESREPGIGMLTERFLDKVFLLIHEKLAWDRQAYIKKLAVKTSTLIWDTKEDFTEEIVEEPSEEDDFEDWEN